jgi:hypothetical protein
VLAMDENFDTSSLETEDVGEGEGEADVGVDCFSEDVEKLFFVPIMSIFLCNENDEAILYVEKEDGSCVQLDLGLHVNLL